MTSFPTEVVGMANVPQGSDNLGQLLHTVLFEPGHPETTLDIEIDRDARAAQALSIRSQACKIKFDVSCQPQVFNADPSRDGSMPEIRPATAGLEQLIGADQNLEEVKDREKWQLLTRELSQKQEIVHRLMRENDDKTQSLKLSTAEIVDLRRALKMMQGESQILRRKLGDQEAAELGSLVLKEISGMSVDDLQTKIVKIAQAYRGERLRNEEFSKALKSANVDLAQAKTISAEHENLQMAFKEQSNKLSVLSKENKKTTLYKDTVKKQEAVIGKLEGLLEKLMRDKKARDAERRALDKSQVENDAKFMTSEEEKLRIQIAKQEEIINDLRDELANVKGGHPDGNMETVELEVKL